jgi:dienelactone hydrolase
VICVSSRIWLVSGLALALAGLDPVACLAGPAARVAPREITLPSEAPSGIAINDRIWLAFYRAQPENGPPAPAVVMLAPLGDRRMTQMKRFARFLAARGIGCALVTLPYHARRYPPGDTAARHFLDPNARGAVQAMEQSVADVRTVVTWLGRQPGVDARRIGIIGVSLGAIVAHLAMGQDARLTAGVAILGAGDLGDLRRTSLTARLLGRSPTAEPDAETAARIRQVDPLQYADRNRPRRVLMIQAARDLAIPPRDAQALWEALGRPPIRWVDTNHFGLGLAVDAVMRISLAYLQSVWDGASRYDPDLPGLWAPTIKFGLLAGLDTLVAPALQWQALSFGRRNHMALLHADLGLTGRGPFVGLAVTLNAFVDLGMGRRLAGSAVKPYLSLHVLF